MLNRIVYSLGVRMVAVLILMGIAGIASLTGHSKHAKAGSSGNPWSKGYVAVAKPAPVHSSEPEYRWVNKRTGKLATQEEIDDEAFRRQMVHEARESYERENGPVDTSDM